jgi:hypothetical protein
MENPVAVRTVIPPLSRAQVFVDSNCSGHSISASEIRNNQSEMPRLRYHRIATVALALATMTGVDVYIRNNRHLPRAALRPHDTKFATVEFDKTIRETCRVDIVVKYEMLNSPR